MTSLTLSEMIDLLSCQREITRIPFRIYDEAYGTLCLHLGSTKEYPLTEPKTFFQGLFDSNPPSPLPVIKAYFESVYFCRIQFTQNNKAYTLVLGPCSDQLQWSGTIDTLTHSLSERRQLLLYFQSLPQVSPHRFMGHCEVCYYLVTGNILDPQLRLSALDPTIPPFHSPTPLGVNQVFTSLSTENHMRAITHHSLKQEEQLMQFVREGNVQALTKMTAMPSDGEIGTLSKSNRLRSEKNLAICAVTIATRAAISGGLDNETALTLSDAYIQEIEEVLDASGAYLLILRMYLDFTTRVREVHLTKVSSPIRKAKAYVKEHLSTSLTLETVAAAQGLSAHYLGDRFKLETGQAFSHYVANIKIEEAKKLLTSSNYSLYAIGNSLGFCDQSHFTRTFKKITGVNPKAFRSGQVH